MEIAKVLYNILRQDITQEDRLFYINSLSQNTLNQIHKQIISTVDKFDPQDRQTIQEIQLALKAYELLLKNIQFSKIIFIDESFICSLGFYLIQQKQSIHLVRGLQFIEHQYFILKQSAYAKNINLFKALSQIYASIDQKYYERLVYLMLNILSNNLQFLQHVNDKYYFLECLIQVVNKEQQPQKMLKLFSQLRKLYSFQKYQLFHQIDTKILIDILIRTITNQNHQPLIEETLKLYLILNQQSIIKNDKYRVTDMHQALNQKLAYIDTKSIGQPLKKIICQILAIS